MISLSRQFEGDGKMNASMLPVSLAKEYEKRGAAHYKSTLHVKSPEADFRVVYHKARWQVIADPEMSAVKKREVHGWIVKGEEPIGAIFFAEYALRQCFCKIDEEGNLLPDYVNFLDHMDQDNAGDYELAVVLCEQLEDLTFLEKFLYLENVWIAPHYRQHRAWVDAVELMIDKRLTPHQFFVVSARPLDDGPTREDVAMWSNELDDLMEMFQAKLGVTPCHEPLASQGYMYRLGNACMDQDINVIAPALRAHPTGTLVFMDPVTQYRLATQAVAKRAEAERQEAAAKAAAETPKPESPMGCIIKFP